MDDIVDDSVKKPTRNKSSKATVYIENRKTPKHQKLSSGIMQTKMHNHMNPQYNLSINHCQGSAMKYRPDSTINDSRNLCSPNIGRMDQMKSPIPINRQNNQDNKKKRDKNQELYNPIFHIPGRDRSTKKWKGCPQEKVSSKNMLRIIDGSNDNSKEISGIQSTRMTIASNASILKGVNPMIKKLKPHTKIIKGKKLGDTKFKVKKNKMSNKAAQFVKHTVSKTKDLNKSNLRDSITTNKAAPIILNSSHSSISSDSTQKRAQNLDSSNQNALDDQLDIRQSMADGSFFGEDGLDFNRKKNKNKIIF